MSNPRYNKNQPTKNRNYDDRFAKAIRGNSSAKGTTTGRAVRHYVDQKNHEKRHGSGKKKGWW